MSVFTHVVARIHAFFLPTAENVLHRPPSSTAWNRGEFHSRVHHLPQGCTHSRHQTQAQGLWAAFVPSSDTSLFLWLSLTELVKALHLLQLTETFFKKKICLSLRAWVFSPYVCIYVMRVSGAFEGPSEGIRSPGTGVEIWVTIWVLGPEPGSSARAANALSRRAISPSPSHQFYDTRWMFYSWIFILFRFGFLRHIMALKLWCAWNSLPDSVLQSLGSRMFARQTGA